jgi:multimeric flavodoxin WrbA
VEEGETSKTYYVLILNGATRTNGNTDLMLKTIVEGSANPAVEINQIILRKKQISDCIGCFHCHENEKCAIKDDMKGIREEINKSDLLIFASPVYWWGVTGIMKTLIDRLYLYHSPLNKKLIAGKKAIVLSPMNMDSDIYKLKTLISFYDIFFENLNIELVGSYYFGNVNKRGEIGTNSEYLRKLKELGKNLSQYFRKDESL